MPKSQKIQTLNCHRCDKQTRGRQWYARISGYGLCSLCAKSLRDKNDLNIYDNYGTRGIHYNVKEKETA